MANPWYLFSVLDGGTDGAMDSVDGDALADESRGLVVTDTLVSFYVLDADSGAAASSPDVIPPVANAGLKRWLLIKTIVTPSPLLFENYDSVNYPITIPEEASINMYDSFAHGRDHIITAEIGSEAYAKGCAILSGDDCSITRVQSGWTFIGGGYGHSIIASEYSAILSGGWNTISCAVTDPAEYNVICGGDSNTISLLAGAYENCTIGGGSGNTISGECAACFIGGGYSNEINSVGFGVPLLYGAIGGGANNYLYSNYGVVAGGNSNDVYGKTGTIGGGEDNSVEGEYGCVPGGVNGSAYLFNQFARGTEFSSSTGRQQVSELTCGINTIDATEKEMFLDDAESARMIMPSNMVKTWMFTIHVVAKVINLTESAFWIVTGAISRDGAGNNTAIIGTPQGTGTVNSNNCSTGATTWSVAVTADDINESLKIAVTGEAAKSIAWLAKVSLVELG